VTVKQALAEARRALAGSTEEADLEAEVLLRETLGRSRAQLYAGLDRPLTAVEDAAFRRLVERRLNDEPTAYILGRREFYSREFLVGPSVLIPRPETEILVEEAVRLASRFAATGAAPRIADIGTGSGAVAVSIALEAPGATVFATDVSADALNVARENCHRHGVSGRVLLLEGDLLDPLPGNVDIIIANLPYVRRDEALPCSEPLRGEPRLALDGGPDGLEHIRRLCAQAPGWLDPLGHVLLEVGEGQADAVGELLQAAFPPGRVRYLADLAGIRRVVGLSL
jgi:release factor glutamine methyltransferase